MTEFDLEKAKLNREARRKAHSDYEKVSEAIDSFTRDDFTYVVKVKMWERGDWKEIYVAPNEFISLLENTRNKLESEIKMYDDAFEEL